MKGIYRPELFRNIEMCEICNRGVGMTMDDRKLPPHPFMCFVCEKRFPPDQWSLDKEGFYFDLNKNGSVWMEGNRIESSLDNKK